MRLLHCSLTSNGGLCIKLGSQNALVAASYAILSHCWRENPEEEVSFQDCSSGHDITADTTITDKPGYAKLLGCCVQALKDGYSYVWIDTCCIDKGSSAELSEAINSMYRWYEMSRKCYVYLEDVESSNTWMPSFKKSRWFTRGWTLQELIAPYQVVFYDAEWHERGNKIDLAESIHSITNVRIEVLRDGVHAHRTSIAEKMSWAAGRKTTREEDRAYSLLGLFEVNMPAIYGEGRLAFTRLQQEIIRNSFDHSILAWEGYSSATGPFALSPDWFKPSGTLETCYPIDYDDFAKRFKIREHKPDYSSTNFGLHIQLPIARVPGYKHYYYGFLACTTLRDNIFDATEAMLWPAIYLYRRPDSAVREFTRKRFLRRTFAMVQIPNQDFDTEPLWLSPYEYTWPLFLSIHGQHRVFRQVGSLDPGRTVDIILVKSHRNIAAADVHPPDSFTRGNVISLSTIPGTWAWRPDNVNKFPDIEGALVSRNITIGQDIRCRSLSYANSHSLATLIVHSLQNDKARTLFVIAVARGSWYLFLSDLEGDETAEECYDGLLSAESEWLSQRESVPDVGVRVSSFTGTGIPFSSDDESFTQSKLFSATVDPIDPVAQSPNLTFRVNIGFGREPERARLDAMTPMVIGQHVSLSAISRLVKTDSLRIG